MSSFHNSPADYSVDSSHSLRLPFILLHLFLYFSTYYSLCCWVRDRSTLHCWVLTRGVAHCRFSTTVCYRNGLSSGKHADGARLGLGQLHFWKEEGMGRRNVEAVTHSFDTLNHKVFNNIISYLNFLPTH